MDISSRVIQLSRRTPLRISRGICSDTVNIVVEIKAEGITGVGSGCPFSIGVHTETTEDILEALGMIRDRVSPLHPLQREETHRRLAGASQTVPGSALAALDTALWDWMGKRAGLPLWRLLGLETSSIPPTSVTIGMEQAPEVRRIVRDWLELAETLGDTFRIFKVKLGSPEGVEADKERVEVVQEEAGDRTVIVDANAAWSPKEAEDMCGWLSNRNIDIVEQPLAVDAYDHWRRLSDSAPVRLFADESCFHAEDLPTVAGFVDGVVVKMMKAGGLTGALRMIHAARACGLEVMLGCYADCAIANTAMSQISALSDCVDLDSHLNMSNDPFTGAELRGGRLIPLERAGIGVERNDVETRT
ncbi:MAG: dipeptide epimerase [Candidatus Brocadiia bacterium]